MKKLLLIFCLLITISLNAQTFEINKLNCLTYIATAGAIDLYNNYFDDKIIDDLTKEELNSLSKDDIPWFDGWISFSYDQNLKDVSDYTYLLTLVSSVIIVYDSDYFLDNLLVLSEILVTQSAVGKWTKTFTQRKRPFVYDEERDIKKRNNQHSFYSLHSSGAFGIATFGYYYYVHNFGKSAPMAIFLFGSAAATAALRVASAQHFPSDVFVGAIVGSSLSYLICKYHHHKKMELNLGFNSINLSYKF